MASISRLCQQYSASNGGPKNGKTAVYQSHSLTCTTIYHTVTHFVVPDGCVGMIGICSSVYSLTVHTRELDRGQWMTASLLGLSGDHTVLDG